VLAWYQQVERGGRGLRAVPHQHLRVILSGGDVRRVHDLRGWYATAPPCASHWPLC
jgi:hypothetical protein